MTYFGYYNETGYWISQPHNGHPLEVYRAGNNPHDSGIGQTLPVGHKDAIPLERIRQHCVDTGKDMAAENHAKWGGAEYEELPEDDV